MRALAVADAEDELLLARLSRRSMGRFDAVISCGDMNPGYLDAVATLANAPLFFVRGNHDTDAAGYDVMGGEPLDGRIVEVAGVRLAGLDGSLLYREGIVGYTEREQSLRAARLALISPFAGGIDVLVTHAPARGSGDMDDMPHRGFSCYNRLLSRVKPALHLCGHVHLDYGMVARERTHASGARVVNAFRHVVVEL